MTETKHNTDKVDYEYMKENMPEQWLHMMSMFLEEKIIEFNEVAEEHDADCIVAFKCTPEERDELTNGLVEEAERIINETKDDTEDSGV